jgi:two-component system, NarL family, nitrate/nitrite response regulator NarL
MPIRVFLVSNFLLLLQGISSLIDSQPQCFSLVGLAETYNQILELININADVIILDIDSNPDEVLLLIETLRSISCAKILLVTRLENISLQDKAIVYGARGIINHAMTPELFLTAIKKVNEGQMWLNRVATERIFVELSRMHSNKLNDPITTKIELLTERELEIFIFIVCNNGESGKIIANKLSISESTLRNHLTSIYEKIGVTNRHGLITFAFQNNLIARFCGPTEQIQAKAPI